MATVAYTSAAINPKITQSDKIIDESATPLPVAMVQLYGDAIDSGDPFAVFTWKWYLISSPAPCAFITPDTDQNPQVGPVNTWGNYLFLLVATSSGPGGASDAVIYRTPTTALVQVRVQSAQYALEKPAKFARKWASQLWQLINVFRIHTIQDHYGVAIANNSFVDILCNSGPATTTGLAGDPPLHLHGAEALPVATTVDLGVSILSDTPVNPAAPVVLNHNWVDLTAQAAGSQTPQGWTHQIQIQQALVGTQVPHMLFHIREDVYLETWAIAMNNGGSAFGGYVFRLYVGNKADWEAGTPALLDATLDITALAAVDGAPLCEQVTGTKMLLTADQYVGVVCTVDPVSALGEYNGWGLTATLHTTREV